MSFALPAALAALAAAPGGKLAIVEVDAPDLMMGLGAQVTQAIVAEAQAQKLAVVSPDELRRLLGAKPFEALRKCHGSVACAESALAAAGCDRAVLGEVGRTEKHYTFRLWLFDLKKSEVLADVDRRVLIAARRFLKDVEQAVPPLLRGERESRGTLTIRASVDNAQVTVDGEFLGAAPLTLPLKPGKYEVKVERPKYLTVQRFVTVEPGQVTEQTFKLLLKPGELPDAEVLPGLAKRDEKPPPPPGPAQLSPVTWLAGGATVASAGLGLYFGLSMRAGDQALRATYDADTAVYGGTRRQALAVQQQALAANICYGIAGAAAVGTVVSLLFDAGREPGPVQVAPAVTPSGAGVVLGGRF